MDQSDLYVTSKREPERASHAMVMLRAVVSAGLFGALGMWVGAKLGHYGNAPGHTMAKGVMKWGMGIFAAVLAVYSSVKASANEEMHEHRGGNAQSGAQKDVASDLQVVAAADKNVPLATVHAAGAEHAGETMASREKQRA